MQQHFVDVAVTAAKQAEEVILRYYGQSLATETKKDNSPVTQADQEAEDVIRTLISTNFPDHGFLGEERGKNLAETGYTWVIDPIDGTKEFTRQNPLFSTQIALVKDDDFIVGVSNAPELKELMVAEKGKGTQKNGQAVHCSSINEINKAIVVTGGTRYFKQAGRVDQLMSLTADAQTHRIYGGFWAYHLLAQGKVDVVIEVNTYIWDIAASISIVREAGCTVTDIEGKPLSLESTSIIAANPYLHPQILSYFNP